MIPVDKFGNKIYTKTYKKMLRYSHILKSHGYKESKKKPNLFYRHDDEEYFWGETDNQCTKVIFFADMRGTESVPIWENTSPLLYARFTGNPPLWLKNRLLYEEFERLKICWLSYEVLDLENPSSGIGYCVVCGKDFQNNGLYCSPSCEYAMEELGKDRCRVCGKLLPYNLLKQHHLSYTKKDEKTIEVCCSCHLKIHRGEKLRRLKPIN